MANELLTILIRSSYFLDVSLQELFPDGIPTGEELEASAEKLASFTFNWPLAVALAEFSEEEKKGILALEEYYNQNRTARKLFADSVGDRMRAVERKLLQELSPDDPHYEDEKELVRRMARLALECMGEQEGQTLCIERKAMAREFLQAWVRAKGSR